MNFTEALEKLLAQQRVTRKEWDDEGVFGFIMDGVLMIRRDFKYHQWILSVGDITATDWEVVWKTMK